MNKRREEKKNQMREVGKKEDGDTEGCEERRTERQREKERERTKEGQES